MKSIVLVLSIFIVVVSCDKKKRETASNEFYICSMDPQVMEKKSGKCPICKMELTKTVVSENKDKESIKLSETQIKLGNIITQVVGLGSVGEGIKLRGNIVADERNITIISSRVSGRIDKLYFKNIGEEVHEGDHLYDIYSEELQAAIKQYLLLKDKARQLNGGNINYNEMMESAKKKLIVWGLTDNQVNKLNQSNATDLIPFHSKVSGVANEVFINEGDYVNEGSSILKVSDYSSLWVEAEAYPQDMKVIKQGLKVNISIDGYPNESVEGIINFENPELETESKINLIRIEIPNPEKKYKLGMRVTVMAFLNESQAIVIPEEAILYQPEMNTIWIQNEKGSFAPRMVETGITNNGKVEIKSGVKEGEMVVVSGAYLIDSEYKLRKGSGDMPGMDHGNKKEEPVPLGHKH